MSEKPRKSRGGHTQRHRNDAGHERSGSRGKGGPRKGYSRHRPSERRRHTTPSRLAAYEAIRRVSSEDAYANIVFPAVLRRHRIEGRDAAFATELFYGSLRAQGRLDAVLAQCVDRSLTKIEPAVLDVLRLGAYQMLDMEVAAHAAASETVGLAREVTGAGSASLVNAVLRRVGERTREQWLDIVVPSRDDNADRFLSITYSHPEWIVRALREALKAHGRDPREIDALLAAQNEAPSVSLVMRPGLTDENELTRSGATPGRWSLFSMAWPGGDPGQIPAVEEGRAAVQDEGSQLVALALALGADTLVSEPDHHWLDLCSGPGGKTALLAGASITHDAEVMAVELQEHRTRLVERSVATLVEAGAEVETLTADGREVGQRFPEQFSRVLADVPCSGLGALRRRPESRWRKKPGDLGGLARLQRELLESAVQSAQVGGIIAYVTCSPHANETLLVVKEAQRRHKDLEVIDAREAVRAGLRSDAGDIDLGDGPYVQLWPHVHGTDAMFLALLRKTDAPTTSHVQ